MSTSPIGPYLTETNPRISDALLAGFGILISYILPIVPVGLLIAPQLLNSQGVMTPEVMTQITRLAIEWQVVTYPLVFAIVWWFVKRNGGPKAFGFIPPSLREVGYASLAALVMLVIVNGAAALISALGVKVTGDAKSLLPPGSTQTYMALLFVTSSILAPIAEEGAFRIIALRTMLPRMSLWLSVGISSVGFACAHINITTLIPLTLGGIILAMLYVRTKNAWLSMITHSLFNGIAILSTIAGGAK